MKNRNLFYTLLLAVPLFVLADNDPDIQVEGNA